jgi:hypothetical protein
VDYWIAGFQDNYIGDNRIRVVYSAKEGRMMLFIAPGGGLRWACSVWRWLEVLGYACWPLMMGGSGGGEGCFGAVLHLA